MRWVPVLHRAEAQAEAGPLMPMVRRANMGLSIAAGRGNRKACRISASVLDRWSRAPCAGRVSGNRDARPDISRHHTAGPDHGAVADGDAGQDDGAAADPDIAADPHRAAEFEAFGPGFGVARVVGGVDLHRRSDLGAVADAYLDDVEDHAIEVQEHAIAEPDIVAEVAKERRPDHRVGADMSETFAKQCVAFGYRLRQRRVVAHKT